MKKVFTIIVALMLSSIGLYAFEKVQLEKFQTLQINELKKGPSLKKAKLLTSTMRHPFPVRVCARLDFQLFNPGLGCSGYRKAA